ncbi:MAG: Ig-like domain-containing protein [Candidatus Symbiothrix sp.]|jgi:hypothetical protein|nr:Ig-like domain-containing protein [Candidatus Symbiothrix sp.]
MEKMKQRTKKTWAAYLAVLWLVLPAAMQAQVHIGGTESAVTGALLDLTTPEGANLGLLPLNVSIEDINEIPNVFTNKASIIDSDLQGLIVYNTNGDLADGVGLYVWDGEQWNQVKPAVTSVVITTTPETMTTFNGTQTLVAEVTPSLEVTGATLTWVSSNPKVATIDATTGVVTALVTGTTNITASAGGVTSDEKTVTVNIIGAGREEIGNNTYDTYCYGGSIGCWMVQNSMEGSGTTSGGIKYYSRAQRVAACVAPWATPNDAQWQRLADYLNGSAATQAEKDMWDSTAAWGGYYVDSTGKVTSKGSSGTWWSVTGTTSYMRSISTSGLPTLYKPDSFSAASVTVRCYKP